MEEASSSPSEPGALPLSGGAVDTLNLLARDARGRGRVWAPLALDFQTLCSHCCEPDFLLSCTFQELKKSLSSLEMAWTRSARSRRVRRFKLLRLRFLKARELYFQEP